MITTLGKGTKLLLIGLNWNQLKELFFYEGTDIFNDCI